MTASWSIPPSLAVSGFAQSRKSQLRVVRVLFFTALLIYTGAHASPRVDAGPVHSGCFLVLFGDTLWKKRKSSLFLFFSV